MMIQIEVLRKNSFVSYILVMMLSLGCPINLMLKLFESYYSENHIIEHFPDGYHGYHV